MRYYFENQFYLLVELNNVYSTLSVAYYSLVFNTTSPFFGLKNPLYSKEPKHHNGVPSSLNLFGRKHFMRCGIPKASREP